MTGWHTFCLLILPILINKKYLAAYKYLKAENQKIYYFILLPDTHPKFTTAKENYEAFSRALLNMKLFPPLNHQSHMSN